MSNPLKLVADVQLSIDGTPLGDREKLRKILHPAYQLVSQAATNWNNSDKATDHLKQSIPVIKEAIVFLCTCEKFDISHPRILALASSLKAIDNALGAYWSDDKTVDDALAAIASANKFLSKSL
jgi:hypothetical protein